MVTSRLRGKCLGDEYWAMRVPNAGGGAARYQRLQDLIDVAKYVRRVVQDANVVSVRTVILELQSRGVVVISEV